MRIRTKAAVMVGTIAVAATALAAPAGAATAHPASWVPGKTHRGMAGCFSYSYRDSQLSVTVYYHHRTKVKGQSCGGTRRIKITVGHMNARCFPVAAGKGGHTKFVNHVWIPKVKKIQQVSKC
ncbi:hypothetical protein [Actinoallomurus sp. NPDC050550]|uniref:hypothetical protein n=1 Tax=Actinoallomurus sp. NPDC050550 TaxID=3154937 RepID=UPI0033CB680F